ncbi:InlB B-repeat-containing protein [Aedoeadaptatus acetigenes]|uniref:InlB B-repeat-containing protein n=1 Tax=Aedoeadaptatus acetigenes TaxID=2981723 RepID=UPI0011DD7793|nr:InlB B-repeat-containing protein [Aedoeadaptatus acetigenes]MCU6785867.1 InlB B-repeat-containing protein [Aedoeadaptatus acetigenes]
MKRLMKQLCLWTLILAMVLSGPASAFAQVNHADLSKDRDEIINKKPVTPAKLEDGQTAAELIKNPDQPKIYTLRTDYKVQRGEKYVVDYQPYIASVGEAATEEEQKKVNQTVKLPDLTGYEKPDDDYLITYDKVKDTADGKGKTGNTTNGFRYQANEDFRYKSKANEITIKHVFQDLQDFTKYTNPDGSVGEKGQLITTQNGNTGSTMEVSPLDEKHPDRKGFVPEAPYITMQVPENAENFILEYRYNRAHYDVNFDTKGGTPVPNRNLYYEQTIPTIDDKSIPTKAGCDFLGWTPSITLETTGGKTYPENQIIKDSDDKPILNLAADLKMPASKITFTAVWKDKPKAEYVIQFWTEKPDYDDKNDALPLRDRYDFIGARRIDNADTGSTPDLTNLDIHGITFPDLNEGRLEKAQDDKKEFERYYFLNEDLTKTQNASEDNPEVQKSVSSTGETVYNVYYNRRVYTLYFTAAYGEAFDIVGSFWPIITRDGKVIGKEGSPYKVDVRFNQSLNKIWPKDAEVSNLPTSVGNEEGDTGLIGWTINNNAGEQAYRDTPPYRLSAEDFIDSQDVVGTGEFEGFGHADQIPIKDGKNKKRDKYEISIGSTSYEQSVVHHIDIIKDDFDGKEQIDYDMSYWKSDTSAAGPNGYPFGLPHLQGFTLKEDTRTAEWIGLEKGRVGTWDARKTFDELNAQRNKKTPFRSDADKIEYIDQFPWGTKSFKGANAYNYANYSRNSYKLKLNNDPKTVKNDSEYGAGNILDVPYEKPLNDLKLDATHKPEKPNWVRDDWSFLGWALDPAGENLVKDGNETKLHYDQVLYAKWGEPDYKWKVIFDPNGGSLRTIDENKLTTERKTVKEGDIGQEIQTTYPIKEKSEGDKQVFKVVHKQELVEPKFKPVRKGYDFMGWEIIRYKKDDKTGDYTEEIDNSYRQTYKVPELYSFGNEVVSPIYLKAIWVPNARVDVEVLHYYLDKDYNLDTNISPNPDPDKLENKRAGYLVATTGDRQDDKYTLVPHDELVEKLPEDLKTIYEEYNGRVKGDNTFFQQFRVEPEKVLDDQGVLVDNPKVADNVFKFFYRPYRQREYKVNYIDERFKGEANEKDGAIIEQELVVNGNRHYDARNYRPIPGWVLTSAPQQQLSFDVNEETNEFIGINGTKSDEITFYYKDVRVIEIPTPSEGQEIPDPPKGYVRVTFKADKGGSFGKDAQGKDITKLHYDVIKGLKSDLLPVPKLLEEGETADQNKYYITPDDGKKFTKWDNKPLLNKNTIINEAHEFTAYFEWSGLTAKGMVRTESFKDPNGKWDNDFAPTIADLKKQLEWREKDEVKPLPDGTTIEFFDENGNELKTNEDVFKLVSEQNKADKDEVVRTVNITVKATFKDGKDPQELNIPITVYKNVYEALNKAGDKPLFLTEAEGKDAKDGGLQDVTGDYVKVTIKASKDFTAKDDKIYYVNKNAWVEIPEVKTEGSSTFVNWTADKAAQNEGQAENGIFDFEKRHKFTENTVISPSDAKDVVEQKQGEDKPKVPDNYVKVIVKTTDKATDDTKFEKIFWVNPTKEVTIPATDPVGKENQKFTFDGLGEKDVNYIFKEWQKVQTGETDESLTKVDPAVKVDLAKNQYTDKVTVIEAAYKKSILPEKIEEPLKTTKLDTPQGKKIEDKDLIEKITPQEGKEIKSIQVINRPDPSKPGEQKATVIVTYTDGSTQGTDKDPVVIPVEVHKNIIPEAPGGQKPKDALDNYVKVIFKAGTGGSLSGDLVYYVSPEVEVDMTDSAKAVTKTPSVGYTANGGTWSPEIKAEKITAEKTYEFNFVKSDDIVEKTDDPNQEIPKGYVTVKFIAGKNGEVVGGNKTYYVNPEANIKLVDKDKATGASNELVVPEAKASDNYGFAGWVEEIDYTNPIKGDREHVAKFTKNNVTLTYKAGEGATGDVPATQSAPYGGKVVLANADKLSKTNYVFDGWKIGETIYKAGEEVTLNGNTTATAQWTPKEYTVMFDLAGGTIDGKTTKDSIKVKHGKTIEEVDGPIQEGKVFMGWKNKGEDAIFDFTKPITADKVLVAQWQEPVQKINDGDPVEEQFIKVTFLKGDHGTLKEGQAENLEKVTYKVAKDLNFADAQAKGLVVPGIVPAKYYKAKAENSGWDKALDLNLEEGQKEKVFTAQYEPEADVIPVDSKVTEEDQIKKEKPEGMVLVQFVVDDNEAYMDGITKYYVAKNKVVDVPSPLVFNKNENYHFNGWLFNDEVTMKIRGSFAKDTVISDKLLVRPEIHIKVPTPGVDLVKIEDLTAGASGKLEVISGGQSKVYDNAMVQITVRQGRKRVTKEVRGFKLDSPLKKGDQINFWATNDNGDSDVYKYIVQ